MIKNSSILLATMAIALTTLSSCEAIKGLIGFGFWLGVIAVVLIIVIIFWVRGRTK
jgi:hypothetical protein